VSPIDQDWDAGAITSVRLNALHSHQSLGRPPLSVHSHHQDSRAGQKLDRDGHDPALTDAVLVVYEAGREKS
jgi:predicted N-acetyltransferase YhbS